ncbi:MAG: hypothetical protein ACOC6C_02060 [Verrucomicrobiota bacterium]
MRHTITAIIVASLLTSANAEEFYMTDAKGRNHGPIEFKEGETVYISGQSYTISKILDKKGKIQEKMKNIIIPAINFRQANIHCVIEFLQQASVEFDSRPENGRQGVNMVLNLDRSSDSPETNSGPSDVDPFGKPPLELYQPPEDQLITFSARKTSLFDVMNIVCKVCNLRWDIQNGVVMIEPDKTK